MASAAGLTAGKYQTLRRLAVGGMGEIFLARERGRLGFDRLVVIKRMLPQLTGDRDAIEMFVDEARIVGHLSHPNICQILELGEDDGVPFLALEYVRGESLSRVWDRASATHDPMPLNVTLRIIADTALALHFAHEACDAEGRPLHVIHRDISPHNVMVSFHGDVKLMDFGIARADNRQHRTDTGKVKGKIAYMSPEQLRGNPLDRRTDVFSVGVMLWELTLRRRLFGGGGEVETLNKSLKCEVPRPRSIDPSYPEELEAIVMHALAADREHRIATAGELASALLDQLAAAGGAERSDVAAAVCRRFPGESAKPEESPPIDQAPDTMLDPPSPIADTMPVTPSGARPTVPLRAEPAIDQRPTQPLEAAKPLDQRDTKSVDPARTVEHAETKSLDPARPLEQRPTTPLPAERSSAEPIGPNGPIAMIHGSPPTPSRRRRARVVAIAAAVVAATAVVGMTLHSDDAPARPSQSTPPAAAAVPAAPAQPPPVVHMPAGINAPAPPSVGSDLAPPPKLAKHPSVHRGGSAATPPATPPPAPREHEDVIHVSHSSFTHDGQ